MDKVKELYDLFDSRYNEYIKELECIEYKLDSIGEKSSSIVVKKINGVKYYYEQWRENDKIKNKSLGRVHPSAAYETEIEIQSRKDLSDRAEELKFLIDCLSKEKDNLYMRYLKDTFDEKFNFEMAVNRT